MCSSAQTCQPVQPLSPSRVSLSLRARANATFLVCLVCLILGGLIPAAFAQSLLTNGLPQTGSISGPSSSETWTFNAPGPGYAAIKLSKVSGGAGFEPKIEVHDSQGFLLGASSGALAARLDMQLAVAGVYTVSVTDAHGTGSGSYQVQFAQIPGQFVVPPGDEGGPLTNGAKQTGAITVGDLDQWTFNTQRGHRVILEIGKVSGGAAFSPSVQVFGPDGVLVGSDSGLLVSKVEMEAPADGTYTVLVSAHTPDATGTYAIEFLDIPGTFAASVGDEGGAITDGVEKTGSITLGDFDPWTFTANDGDRITLQLTEVSGGAAFNPGIELIGPGGMLQATAQGASSATIDTAIEVSGTYTVIVSDAAVTGTGTYRLLLTRSTVGAQGAKVLTNGSTAAGSINAAGQTNFWTFAASQGNRIVVRAGKSSGAAGFAPWIRLMNPNGTVLGSASGASGAEIAVTSTNTGVFTVAVSDGSAGRNQTGGYRITLAKPGTPVLVAAGDEGGPMTNGFSHTGTIDLGDMDLWTFSANSGDSIVVRMGELTTGSLTPQLRLYGPDGTLVSTFGASSVASEVSTRATNSGMFTVIASDFSSGYGGSGGYRLKLAKTASPIIVGANDDGGPMINGFMHTGAIDPGDLDVWNFAANEGESIVVRMGVLSTASSLTPYLRLYGPDGTLLSTFGSSSVASEVSTRATNSGIFTIIASDLSSAYAGNGTYRLKLAKTGSPVVLAANDEGGQMVNGSLQTGNIDLGDMDVWTFRADPGESIILRMGELNTGSLTPELRLYGPDGTLLSAFGSSSVASEVSTRATNSGVFTVIASDLSSAYAGSGAYRLKLAESGTPILVSNGDEGGAMLGVASYDGNLAVGELDAWSFTACRGDIINVGVSELVSGSSLTPYLRLYGPDGVLVRSASAASTVQFGIVATNSGSFMVVVADLSSAYGGSGTYRLTVNGLSDGPKMCLPRISGATALLTGIGGPAGTNFVLLSTTNVTAPPDAWSVLETNQFSPLGLFNYTNSFSLSETQRFFRFKMQ